MPLMARGVRTTSGGGQRRHSIIGTPKLKTEPSGDQDAHLMESKDSLHLKSSNSESHLPLDQPVDKTAVPASAGVHEATTLPQARNPRLALQQSNRNRFSLLKFRHASDPQLNTSYTAADTPPLPPVPTPIIITTSPTANNLEKTPNKKPKHRFFGRSLSPSRLNPKADKEKKHVEAPKSSQTLGVKESQAPADDGNGQHVSFEAPTRPTIGRAPVNPPPYGDESNTTLALPASRLSESSRSDGSSGDHGVYAQTTTTHTIHTTTTFFRLPRRNKNKGPLFPLPVKIPPPSPRLNDSSRTPRDSVGARTSMSPSRGPLTTLRNAARPGGEQNSPLPSPTLSTTALTNAPLGSPGPSIFRKESTASHRSGTSSPSINLAPPRIGNRGRSSTMGSLGKSVGNENRDSPPQIAGSGRTSTSTAGRKSFGDLFSLSHRLRQNSEPPSNPGSGTPGTPGSFGSKTNSMQMPRELAYPQRAEEDTPASYLEKLEAAVPRGLMAAILCKGSDEFAKTCLRKYMRGFSYFTEAIDMSIRKMLMDVELPKETQQIDRLLQGFADRYCECNPGIFVSPDEAYFVGFSILLLHSDTHNKNNKKKMQKQDYVKNTRDQVEVSHDILECFYDNVSYTPFIHFEDDVAINSHRLTAPKPRRKGLLRTPSTESLRGPVDPYTLILDGKLDTLRPSLKEVMDTEDTYSAPGTTLLNDTIGLHNAFCKSGILQIVSARSRPDAFRTQATISNPSEARAGLVDIKAAKVGLLWRKDPKKKKTKSPWQEWGAILTSSQLYFFRDIGWIKKLISQHEAHQKQGPDAGPVLFRPPLTSFDPNALMSMDDAVALLDTSYKKHKNAFVFIKHGGFEEVFLANDETDMNDWIAKLNYAATFRTAGVRMRGQMSMQSEKPSQSVSRLNSASSERTVSTQAGQSQPQLVQESPHLAGEIMAYRSHLIINRINDAAEKLTVAQKELDNLLRNARHLQVLTPIQSRTREGLVLAAGRMSAKLKWTRVDIWRTKCHRNILRLDLEQEESTLFAHPISQTPSSMSTPRKTTPLKLSAPSAQSLGRSETKNSDLAASPMTSGSTQTSRTASQSMIDKIKSPEAVPNNSFGTPSPAGRHRSFGSLDVPASTSASFESHRESFHPVASSPGSHVLVHQGSVLSSQRRTSNSDSRISVPTTDQDDCEERMLREAGLLGLDGNTTPLRRPDTSGSDRDRVGAISPTEVTQRERVPGARRSLHRTLRDSSHTPHLPQHHRSKKGRDSNSSAVTDDGTKSIGSENDGLARGAGSFILHGKKASVITFGSEWQAMGSEERSKLRRHAEAEAMKEEEVVDDDDTISNVRNALPKQKSRPNSTVTAKTHQDDEDEDDNIVGAGDGEDDEGHLGVSIPSLGMNEDAVEPDAIRHSLFVAPK